MGDPAAVAAISVATMAIDHLIGTESERDESQIAEPIAFVTTTALALGLTAEEIRHGRKPSPHLVRRTTDLVWMESGKAVREAVVRARMEERPYAEDALRDLDVNGGRVALPRPSF
jgi:hypothetical protein